MKRDGFKTGCRNAPRSLFPDDPHAAVQRHLLLGPQRECRILNRWWIDRARRLGDGFLNDGFFDNDLPEQGLEILEISTLLSAAVGADRSSCAGVRQHPGPDGLPKTANPESILVDTPSPGTYFPSPTNFPPSFPMANAQVILKEKIEGLGVEADVVKVRAGYARNFLIPQGKAYEANRANLRHLEALKTQRARREADELVLAQELATKISKLKPKFTLSTGQGGKAFGSVTSMDIHKELEAAGIVVDRHSIELDKPIKKSGKSEVGIRLHSQVTATLTINVDAGDTPAEG